MGQILGIFCVLKIVEVPNEIKVSFPILCTFLAFSVNRFFCFRWITPVLLLIDFYEKTAISSKRRAQMTKVRNI